MFEEFVAAELGSLSRYARVLTGDRDTAHDVLADALVKARLKWSRISRVDSPAAYVRAMVTNGFLSDRRRWASRNIRPTAEIPEVATPAPGSVIDDREQLAQMLRTLPRQQRAAIVLRYFLDVPDGEIADELGCSTGAVRTYVSRGLASLRLLDSDPATLSTAPPVHVRDTDR